LKALSQRYSIARITLLDLFPQTYHFETIVHLQQKDKNLTAESPVVRKNRPNSID
jgi:hypothetical protein